MKKKSRYKFIKKGSIGESMLTDEQMSVLIKKSIISIESKPTYARKEKRNGSK